MAHKPTIRYTKTDEAPALATRSLLPIIEAFTKPSGIEVEPADISLVGRILANFPDALSDEQKVPDALSELGRLAKTPYANIIKLPNISASVPQLKAAIAELQENGFDVPDYPEEPETDAEQAIHDRYEVVKGSAVNPVLRQGNSDRRVPRAVKEYARNNPHPMGEWSSDSKTHVSTMGVGDFRANEKSVTVDRDMVVRIEQVHPDGEVTILKDDLALLEGEIIDASLMEKQALLDFLRTQVDEARDQGCSRCT